LEKLLKSIKIRPYKESEKHQVIDLLNTVFQPQEYFSNERSSEWWNWKYERNVFGKSIIIIAEDNDRVVGARIFWAWNFSVEEKL
jgi:hypothetical protein